MKFLSKINNEDFYQWDYFSDQPYPIRSKSYKRLIRFRALPASLKMILISLFISPIVFINSIVKNKTRLPVKTNGMIGLCINVDKDIDLTAELINELGVGRLSLRVPLSDIANIDKYVYFAQRFSAYDLFVVVLQDRYHIENKSKCQESLEIIFSKLSPFCVKYQIGNAINRTKWGFNSIDEYFDFFKIAQDLRDFKFPQYMLIGSAIIDFEIYAILRSMWHLKPIRYDAIAALLYVDRRGAPENKQFSFALVDKIGFIKSSAELSGKTGERVFITEVNWPIAFTRPYAPALDDVWVSESCYANYMLRYFLLAMASGKVETIYWHQLVAPGYGLVDSRDNKVIKRDAYYFFKTLNQLFTDAEILMVENIESIFMVKAKSTSEKSLWAVWSVKPEVSFALPSNMDLLNAFGEKIVSARVDLATQVKLTEQVVYFVEK